MSDHGPLSLDISDAPQWRAQRMQLVNWGGFHGYTQIPFSDGATLLAGATGSGKSTVLDAYLALMMDSSTPFNGASNDATIGRARSKEQRSVLTYLRGKLDDTADESNPVRVLRGERSWTWGAIAVTFVSDDRNSFTVLRIFHAKRRASTDGDITKKLCTVDGDIDLHELEDLASERFDKKTLTRRFPTLTTYKTYAHFSTMVQTRLGIGAHGDGRNALDLLARIQAGKAMPTVDSLFKTMVLDEPATFRHADAAVEHFAGLEEAYTEMVTAQQKQQTLAGIVDAWTEREQRLQAIETIDDLELDRGSDSPFNHWADHLELTQLEIAAKNAARDIVEASAEHSEQDLVAAKLLTARLKAESAYQDAGGARLGDIDAEISSLTEQLAAARVARNALLDATSCLALDFDSEPAFAAAHQAATSFLDHGHKSETDDINAERQQIGQLDLWPRKSRRDEAVEQQKSLAGRTGNMRHDLHLMRVDAADALGVEPSDLPFLAELIDINAEQREWSDAAEAALGSITRVLIVDHRRLKAFSAAINDRPWKRRLQFEGVEKRDTPFAELDTAMVSGKLLYADSPYAWWVQQRVTSNDIDALCVDTADDLEGPGRRVTRTGQTRQRQRGAHGRANDHSIIGFDNSRRVAELAEEIRQLNVDIKAAEAKMSALDTRSLNLTAEHSAHSAVRAARWDSIDDASLQSRIDQLVDQRQRIVDADDQLAELETQLTEARDAHDNAQKQLARAANKVEDLEELAETLTARDSELRVEVDHLVTSGRTHNPEQAALLDEFADDLTDTTGYDPIRFATQLGRITKELGRRRQESVLLQRNAEQTLANAFNAYQRQWPDPNLGTAVASYPDYLRILDDITATGLHSKRDAWARSVTNWTGDDLVPLNTAIDSAVDEINERLSPVNAILATLEFGARRERLRIDLRELHHDDHIRFRKTLRNLSSDVLGDVTFEVVEARFEQLRQFISMIRPGRSDETHNRDYYLDVRRHIELSAVVVDEEGDVRVKFTSLGGKSGGESQELAAFIVGAALRYQLGDEHRSRPRFAPVFLDEGFVKADSEFAGRSVKAWQGLGFQLIIATAFGAVSALEPHMALLLEVTKNPATGRAAVHVLNETDR